MRLTVACARRIAVAVLATGLPLSIASASTSAAAGTVISQVADASGPRLALIIGNSEYGTSGLSRLPNPVNDAQAVADALEEFGFEVFVIKDADQRVMKRAIVSFGERLRDAGAQATSLFFYAGHGIQSRGVNYLVPVGAKIRAESDVDIESVAAEAVLAQMEEAGTKTNIVILDACRNMPLARAFRSAGGGLAPMDAPNGTFIAYSTAPGSVAEDGVGQNSPFVTALLENIRRPGEPIEAIFRDVRRTVLTVTEGHQRPWDASSLIAPFYFGQASAVIANPIAQIPVPGPPITASLVLRPAVDRAPAVALPPPPPRKPCADDASCNRPM